VKYGKGIKIDEVKIKENELLAWEAFGLYLLKTKRFTKRMKPYKMLQRLLVRRELRLSTTREMHAAKVFNKAFTAIPKKRRYKRRSYG